MSGPDHEAEATVLAIGGAGLTLAIILATAPWLLVAILPFAALMGVARPFCYDWEESMYGASALLTIGMIVWTVVECFR